MIAALVLATLWGAARAWADPPGPDPAAPTTAAAPATGDQAPPASDGPVLTPPEEFKAIDKPNDSGSAIIVTWKKMPYEGRDVFYEVLMSDKEDGVFWPQGRLLSQYRSNGPYAQLLSEFPGAFGFERNHIEG